MLYPRSDVVKSKIRSGQFVLKEDWPHIPDNWNDRKREATAQDLFVFGEYARKGKKVRDLAADFDCDRSFVEFRIRRAVRFLFDHGWIVPGSPAGPVLPAKLST